MSWQVEASRQLGSRRAEQTACWLCLLAVQQRLLELVQQPAGAGSEQAQVQLFWLLRLVGSQALPGPGMEVEFARHRADHLPALREGGPQEEGGLMM